MRGAAAYMFGRFKSTVRYDGVARASDKEGRASRRRSAQLRVVFSDL